MNLKNILKGVVKITLIFIFVITIYLGSVIGAEGISDFYSEEIKGESNLFEVLNKEKARLDMCKDYEILIKIIDEEEVPYATKLNHGLYEIGLYETSNLSIIRHELYHIEDQHTESNKENLLKYLFVEEPQAAVYQLLGLKI